MRLVWADRLATLFVAVALVVYVAWLAGAELPGMSGTKAMTVAVLVLAFAACLVNAIAQFGEGGDLVQAPKVYLAVGSLIGLTAATATVIALVNASGAMLAVLVASTAVLWLMATVRHVLTARDRARRDEARQRATREGPRSATPVG